MVPRNLGNPTRLWLQPSNGWDCNQQTMAMMTQRGYPLVMTNRHSYWKWPSRNSEFVTLNMVIFHSYVNVYQAGYAAMLHGTANSFMLQSPTLRYRSTAEWSDQSSAPAESSGLFSATSSWATWVAVEGRWRVSKNMKAVQGVWSTPGCTMLYRCHLWGQHTNDHI